MSPHFRYRSPILTYMPLKHQDTRPTCFQWKSLPSPRMLRNRGSCGLLRRRPNSQKRGCIGGLFGPRAQDMKRSPRSSCSSRCSVQSSQGQTRKVGKRRGGQRSPRHPRKQLHSHMDTKGRLSITRGWRFTSFCSDAQRWILQMQSTRVVGMDGRTPRSCILNERRRMATSQRADVRMDACRNMYARGRAEIVQRSLSKDNK
jgi:hypothetical protein